MKIHAPALALGLSLLGNVALMPAFADTAAAPAPVSSDAAAKETSPELKVELKMDAKADAILHKVSDFYAGLKSFATTMEREGKNGKESHKATYKVSVEKPNKISIEISGGAKRFDGGQAKMNGEKLFLYNPVFGYVSSPATSNYEDLIRDHEFQFATAFALHGQNLLEALLTENPYDFMQNHYGIKGAELVGEEKLDGVQTNHLRLESHRVSYDVWVDAGDKPWVRKVQAESTKHKDQTQRIIVTHYEMNGSAKPSAATFSFKAPASAKEIPSFFGQAKEATKEAAAPDQSVKVSHSANPLLNKPAPELSLDTVGGGKLDLSSYKDKNVVVLDFWATWCPPCRMSLPILSEVTKAYEDKGVKFFAIDLKEDTSKVKEFLKNQNLDINVALDKDGQAAGKYGVQSIPQSVIIGKDGTVRVVHVGFNSNLKARLAAELDEALTGKEVVAQ